MNPAPARILVIGDEPHFRYLLQRYIRMSAHQSLLANLGEDALLLAIQEKPLAIVLQVDAPATLGWQMLKVLKTDQCTADIPVVICSWTDEEKRSLEEGAEVHLRLPILYEDFLIALKFVGIIPYDSITTC